MSANLPVITSVLGLFHSGYYILCTSFDNTGEHEILALVVRRLNLHSPELACKLLKRFLMQRLVPHGNEDWIFKTLITLVWITTTDLPQSFPAGELSDFFGDFFTAWNRCLSPEATHGALVVRALFFPARRVAGVVI